MLRIVVRLLALVLILLVTLVGGVFLLSGERLAKIAGDQISTTLGREVRITDDLRPLFFPNLGVRTGAFAVSGSTDGDSLIIGEGLSVGVDLLALLSRRIDVKEITLLSPTVTLVKYADGRTNWSEASQDDTERGDETGKAFSQELSIASLSIRNGTISYRNTVSDQDLLFEDINLSAAMADANAPLTASFGFSTRQQPVSGDIQLESLSQLLTGDLTGVSLDTQIGQNTIGFAGDMSSKGVLQGDLVADLPSPDALMAKAGPRQGRPSEHPWTTCRRQSRSCFDRFVCRVRRPSNHP